MKGAIVRGGTSKGVFFREDEFAFPRGSPERDEVIRRAFGVPDPTGMQIDGLGGGISSTSKVVFVGKSQRPGFDLDYDFGQVGMINGNIDWSGGCGNLASAVLLFAKTCGLVPDTTTQARVWQVNVKEEIQIVERNDVVTIAGVPGRSKAIELSFMGNPEKSLLPTGNVVDDLNGTTCTLIQGSNPTIFVSSIDPALPPQDAKESEIDSWIEEIRRKGAQMMGIPCTDALRLSFVDKPRAYTDTTGRMVKEEDHDIRARITAMAGGRRFHHAFTGTGSANLAIAFLIPGSVVNQTISAQASSPSVPFAERTVRIGHPGGVMDVTPRVEFHPSKGWRGSVKLVRTARLLMKGLVHA